MPTPDNSRFPSSSIGPRKYAGGGVVMVVWVDGGLSGCMTIAGVSTSDETPPVSLVDALVSSITPRVRAITYEVTS